MFSRKNGDSMSIPVFCIATAHSLKPEMPGWRSRPRISMAWPQACAHLAVAIILTLGKPSYGQQQVTQEQVVRDPQAVSLLQHAWSQMDGSIWSAGQSVQLSGTLDTYQGRKQGGSFSLSVTPSGDTNATMTDARGNTTGYSRKGGLLSTSLPGKPSQSQPPHTALTLPPYFPIEIIHKALSDSTWSVTSLGTSNVGSAACTEVEIKHVYPLSRDRHQVMSKFTERHLFIDTQTGLVDRIEYTAYDTANTRITASRTLDYADYREVGQYYLPSSITDTLHGQTLLHMNVTAAAQQ
jgi:hypothetical protein